MLTAKAVHTTDHALAWCRRPRPFTVWAVFAPAVYLRDADGAFLLLVNASQPPDPLSIVVEPLPGDFTEWLLPGQTGYVKGNGRLTLPSLTVHTAGAPLWSARPAWEHLADRMAPWSPVLPTAITDQLGRFASRWQAATTALITAVAHRHLVHARQAAEALAGLGPGLTPAGDDYLQGVLLALWASWPANEARAWSETLATAAAPHTTGLSAAWLRTAGRGLAAGVWHQLVAGWVARDVTAVNNAVTTICEQGATSGAATWAGFCAAREAAQTANARSSAASIDTRRPMLYSRSPV